VLPTLGFQRSLSLAISITWRTPFFITVDNKTCFNTEVLRHIASECSVYNHLMRLLSKTIKSKRSNYSFHSIVSF
jgi:hypothetical protein